MPTHGPLIISLSEPYLSQKDKINLAHPLLGGIILFSRNFLHKKQVSELVHEIKQVNPNLLLYVDQEGGQVQRFNQNGFEKLPAISLLGRLSELGVPDSNICRYAWALGYKMAFELRDIGVDISFAPVLDAPTQPSLLLDNRAFARTPEKVLCYARAYIDGMHEAGMPATGKHYPGHGGVKEDSHLCLPFDYRNYSQVLQTALPFTTLIKEGLPAVMAAHLTFPQCDIEPAGFSEFWLKTVLRDELKFNGVVFSDDLMMKGAFTKGSIIERAQASLSAGCDYIIVCNDTNSINTLLAGFEYHSDHEAQKRREQFLQRYQIDSSDRCTNLQALYSQASCLVEQFQYHLSQLNKQVAH